MGTSSTSLSHELIPQLATSLGQVRRVPGKGDEWVTHVIAALEREHDPRFERMRRRIGFARKLSDMAELAAEDIALATLGLFFHELLPAKPNGVKAARTWRDYFWRNEEWLQPALDICEAVRSPEWPETESAAQTVAKVAAVYDSQTLDQHERTLQVVEAIVAAAQGRAAQRIVDLLWTEEGQELCDHHFRRHPRGYRLDPEEIRRCIAMLYRVTPRFSSDVPIQPLRFSGSHMPQANHKEVATPMVPAQHQPTAFDNFDRRREALRSRGTEQDPAVDSLEQDKELEPAESEDVEEPLIKTDRPETQSSRPGRNVQQGEERMNQITSLNPNGRGRLDALQLTERLQQLRIQLGQIQQIAAQAEDLIAGIAPQMDEFGARIADVEAVMDRWQQGRSAAA